MYYIIYYTKKKYGEINNLIRSYCILLYSKYK
jgi:hypothetical protein